MRFAEAIEDTEARSEPSDDDSGMAKIRDTTVRRKDLKMGIARALSALLVERPFPEPAILVEASWVPNVSSISAKDDFDYSRSR